MVDEFAVGGMQLARRAFGKAAFAVQSDPGSDKIPQILSERLMQRLSSLAIEPATVLDLGSPLPARQQQLAQAFPGANSLRAVWHERQLTDTNTDKPANNALRRRAEGAAGIAATVTSLLPAKLQGILLAARRSPREFAADPCCLPLSDASVDLVIACQVLPWCGDPGALFREAYRVLRPGGAFFWSSAGPDTLQEYRQLWLDIDPYPHVFGLHDMHDLGDDMLRSGFDSPVMDRENLTINYPSVVDLVADMRAAGAVGLAAGRRRGLMAASVSDCLQSAAGSSMDVTFEHIQGHGWKSHESGIGKVGQNNGEVRIPVSAIGRGGSR